MDVAEFDLNQITPAFIENPHPTLRALREKSPVHRNPDGSVFLTRYSDCLAVYRAATMSSDKREAFATKFGACPLYEHHTTSLVFNDPPNHTIVRKLISGAFTPRKLAEFEPLIEDIVERLLDRLEDLVAFDLVSAFASVLPTEIIALMLGVPDSQRGHLREFSLSILGALDPVVSEEHMQAGNKAVSEFSALLEDLINHRRANPDAAGPGEVLEALIFGQYDGRRLTQSELIQNCIFLLNAGHETTTSFVSNVVGLLLDHPAGRAALCDDASLITGVAEESLRMESPLQIGNRLALEDIRLGDTVIEQGTFVHTSIAAANRDPAVFENPDEFDVFRAPNKHIAFITGIHVCLGATLARLEGRLAVGKLMQRFPNLQRDGVAKRLPLARFRGFAHLPVRI